MSKDFKVGDLVEWNSEAGIVQGKIKKKITSEITFKGYKVHASKEEPQYLIKSTKTDHMAMHKGSALKKIEKKMKADVQYTNIKYQISHDSKILFVGKCKSSNSNDYISCNNIIKCVHACQIKYD